MAASGKDVTMVTATPIIFDSDGEVLELIEVNWI
jgi:hypothetical protein